MSVFKDFPGLENLEKIKDFQGPAKALCKGKGTPSYQFSVANRLFSEPPPTSKPVLFRTTQTYGKDATISRTCRTVSIIKQLSQTIYRNDYVRFIAEFALFICQV